MKRIGLIWLSGDALIFAASGIFAAIGVALMLRNQKRQKRRAAMLRTLGVSR